MAGPSTAVTRHHVGLVLAAPGVMGAVARAMVQRQVLRRPHHERAGWGGVVLLLLLLLGQVVGAGLDEAIVRRPH
jgi:hypothetical protein